MTHKFYQDTTPTNRSQGFSHRTSKHKRKGIDFYAWQEPDRYIGSQLYSSSDFVKIPRTRFSEDRYINAREEADFVTISTFKRAWHYETYESGERVRKLGRNKEFLDSIEGCFTDIDGPDDLIVDEGIILQRCKALGLPDPSYILRTSFNHYQVVWLFTKPLILNKAELLEFWTVTNKALNEAFKDLGADVRIASDATRYLRNPHKKGAVNLKYPDKPKVILMFEGGTVTLSGLYYLLKDHGCVKQLNNPRKHRKLPAGEPERRINMFISNNPGRVCTYKEISELTGVSERAIHYLREHKKIVVERIRTGKTYKIKIKQTPNSWDCKSYYNSNASLGDGLWSEITLFNENGLNFNFRNIGLWMLTLFLKGNGYADGNLIENTLKPGLEKCKPRGKHKFDEKEWQRTIRSALKDKYRFYHNSPWAKELYDQLNENHLQSQKPPKTLEKFDAITNGYSRPVEGKSEHSHTPSVKSTSGN